MSQTQIRFEDGDAYERSMGAWSLVAGTEFLDWLAPTPGLRWLDVGCGSGAFTELLIARHAPAEAHGIDPAPAQLAYARARHAARAAHFQQGDAMALPFPDDRFDAAAMALVIHFVPDPARGVAEMARVVRPGGIVAAYTWDMAGGGFPFAPVRGELAARGHATLAPPSADASDLGAMAALWTAAGLRAVETRAITVRRRFADFEVFWETSTINGRIRPTLAALTAEERDRVKDGVRARLTVAADGSVTHMARANAVRGQVPPAG